MYFVLQTPSLQHLAGVKIVAHLWNQRDVFASFDSLLVDQCQSDESPAWLKFTDAVKSKISALQLPERLRKQLIHLIYPLGIEIMHWYQYHNEDSGIKFLNILLSNQLLCWTMHGRIDYAKTAELMVKDEKVDLQKRFELACINCLENEARELFQRVVEERGQEWVLILRYAWRYDLFQLILFFTRSINLDVRRESIWFADEPLNSQLLFKCTLQSGNRKMSEYLFTKFSQAEKERLFKDCHNVMSMRNRVLRFPTSHLYYLSLMNEEQQIFMFEECIYDVLLCLLHWPMQSLFVEAAKCGWQFMDNCLCSEVLFTITREIKYEGSNDYDYCQLFWECWSLSSADYKRLYLNNYRNLDFLLYTDREEFIKLMLNGAPSHYILALCNGYFLSSKCEAFKAEKAISEAALMECKQTAALDSANEPEDEEKRLKSQNLSRLVDLVMDERMKRREWIARLKMHIK